MTFSKAKLMKDSSYVYSLILPMTDFQPNWQSSKRDFMTANTWIKTLHLSQNVFWYICETFKNNDVGFPGGPMVKNTPTNAGDTLVLKQNCLYKQFLYFSCPCLNTSQVTDAQHLWENYFLLKQRTLVCETFLKQFKDESGCFSVYPKLWSPLF